MQFFSRKACTWRWVVLAFFAAFFVTGCLAYKGYGISWDEPNMYNLGRDTFDYVFRNGQWPTDPANRFHGPVVELVLYGAQEVTGFSDSRDIYLLRHFLTFLFFFIGVFFFYRLANAHFKDGKLALLGAVLLAVSPRLFAHSFYNSRDVPNLAFFLIGIYTLIRLLERKTVGRAVLHGVACGLAMSLRLTALLLPAYTLGFLLYEQVSRSGTGQRGAWRQAALMSITYLVVLGACTVAFWPFLWEQPLQHFIDAYVFASHQGVGGFYFGRMFSAAPWHYNLVWIGLTTPPFYTFAFLVGVGACVGQFLRHVLIRMRARVGKKHRTNETSSLERGIFLAWFFVPILLSIFLDSGSYDEWRHIFFIYPAFLLLALHGLRILYTSDIRVGKWSALLAVQASLWMVGASSVLTTVLWMVRNHPFEHMYFSVPPAWAEANFELDYWGLSYRQAFDYLLAHDTRSQIAVHPTGFPGTKTSLILMPEERKRILLTDSSSATYVLDNFRTDDYRRVYPPAKEIHSITVDGMKILTIYKMR